MIKGLEIKKNANLEMIRALAIIFVLYAHIAFFCFGNFAVEPWLGYILGGTGQVNTSSDFSVFTWISNTNTLVKFDYGKLGIGLFFLLSGYLFAEQSLKISVGEIFVKRIFRISIPIIVIFVTLKFIFLPDYKLIEKHTPIGILFFPFPIIDIGIFWTIQVELLFYLLFLIFKPNTFKKMTILIFFLVGFKFLVSYFIDYSLFEFYYKWQIFLLIGSSFIFGANHILIIIFFLLAKYIFNFSNSDLISVFIAYILFFFTLKVKTIPHSLKNFFGFVARVSYSVYLIHLLTICTAIFYLQNFIGFDLAFLAGFLFTFLASYLSAITIEKFSINCGKSTIKFFNTIKKKNI